MSMDMGELSYLQPRYSQPYPAKKITDASNATPAQPNVFATSTVSLKDVMSIAGARKVSQVG